MQLKELNMRPEEDGRVIIPAEVLEAIGTNADGTVYVTYLAEEDSAITNLKYHFCTNPKFCN